MKIVLNNTKYYRPAQAEIFIKCKARFILLKAGRKFGKTWGAMRWLLCEGFRKEGKFLPCFWVSPTIEMARRIFEIFRRVFKRVIIGENLSRRQITLANGRDVFFSGCENYSALEDLSIFALVLDECRHISNYKIFDESLRPTLSAGQSQGGGRAALISTPGESPFHWFSALFSEIEAGKKADWACFLRSTLDGENISADEINLAKEQLPPDIFKRNYEGVEAGHAGLIFKEFGPHNLIDLPPGGLRGLTITVGVDFGSSESHPTVFIVTGKDPQGINYALDEIYINRASIEETLTACARIEKEFGKATFYTDHNRPDYFRRFLGEGYRAFLTKKDVIWGIEIVRELLFLPNISHEGSKKSPKLLFLKNKTKRLQEEIQKYSWKEGKEAPEKVFDDGVDALRYALVMANQSPAKIHHYGD